MSTKYKYPRTPHCSWSPGATSDDIQAGSMSHFEGQNVVVTEKRDGESTTLYRDGLHARSLDSRHHPSRDWVKRLQGDIGHLIPKGYRVCGENIYARHSLGYNDLTSYFEVFSIWNDTNHRLLWEDTKEWCALLGLTPVPTIYEGVYDEKALRQITTSLDTNVKEGIVICIDKAFHYDDFGVHMAKWVRPNHVTTEEHWMFQDVTPNGLRE